MRESIRDPQRLEHIKDACNSLIDFQQSENIFLLNEKDVKYYGLVKLLEIIGEAAYKLTGDFKENHPATPWRQITDMRHILVHGYYHVNKEDVFKTLQENIPLLLEEINGYLKEYEN